LTNIIALSALTDSVVKILVCIAVLIQNALTTLENVACAAGKALIFASRTLIA